MTRRRTFALAVLMILGAVAAFGQVGSSGSTEGSTGPLRPVTATYTLTVNSNVRGATIYLNGVRQNERTPAELRLREGTYTVRVEARGYDVFQTSVSLTASRTIYANLRPPTATVMLEVPQELLNDRIRDPWRMIDFYLDGRLRPEAQVEVEPGYHTIEIVSGGLRFTDEFYFEAGRYYTLELLLRASLYSTN